MRSVFVVFVTGLLLTFAPLAQGQQGLGLGAVFQVDNDRLESAPGVTFSMAVYDSRPPVRGVDSRGLIGLFTSTIGQYPVIYRGLWLKVFVHPGGFKNLQGVDFDPTGHAQRDDKNGWEALESEEGGGFSYTIRADQIGALPMRFRVRHRDGRDRFTILIITLLWTRGGNLPTALEVMVQREPATDQRGEDLLQFLRGFMSATARAEGQQATQTQKIEVPAQIVSKTVTAPVTIPVKDNPPPVNTKPEISDLCSVTMGAYHNDGQPINPDRKRWSGYERRILNEAISHTMPQSVGEVCLSHRRDEVLFVLTDSKPFKAEVLVGDKAVPLTIEKGDDGYRAVAWGPTKLFVEHAALLNVTDSAGRLRTISFVWGKI